CCWECSFRVLEKLTFLENGGGLTSMGPRHFLSTSRPLSLFSLLPLWYSLLLLSLLPLPPPMMILLTTHRYAI
ncbi:unnamed protein product, partial [Arabidopsis halleri]